MATKEQLDLIVRMQDDASKKLSALESKLGKVSKSGAKLSSAFSVVKKSAFAFGAALATGTGFAVKYASQFENLEKRFKVLLGSTDEAKERLKELNQFALSTPFQVPELAKASATLQTFAGDALATGEGLRFVGDMAAFAQQPVDQIAIHAGRIVDALQSGRPFGESAMRLQELGLISGSARASLESFAGETMQSAEAIEILQKHVTNVSGTMEEMNNTIQGQTSNVIQQFTNKVREVGEALVEAIDLKEVLRKFAAQIASFDISPFVRVIKNMVWVVRRMADDVSRMISRLRSKIDDEVATKIRKVLEAVGKFLATTFVAAWKASIKAIELTVLAFAKFMEVFGDDIARIFNFVTDVVREASIIITNMLRVIINVLEGDFAMAWENLQRYYGETWNSMVSITESAINNIGSLLLSLAGPLGKIAKMAQEKLGEEMPISLDMFKFKTQQVGKVYSGEVTKWTRSTRETSDSVTDDLADMALSFDSMASAASGSTKKAEEDIGKFADNLSDTVEKITSKIKGLRRDIGELTGDFAAREKEDRAKLAEAIVANEEKITDLQADEEKIRRQLRKADDAERRQELQTQLEEIRLNLENERTAREENANLIKQFENEVAEVKRRNSLSGLELAIESFEKERAKAKQIYQEKIALIKQEIAELQKQKDETVKLAEDKFKEIDALNKKGTVSYTQELDTQLSETRKQVQEMIALFQKLNRERAKATGASVGSFGGARAMGGPVSRNTSYLVGEKGPELFTPNTSGNIIPNNKLAGAGGNITVIVQGSVTSERDLVDVIKQTLVDDLSLSTAVA